MRLKRLEIEGYRRIRKTEIVFGDATFLIGENNVGKSAILKALELFHSGDQKLEEHDFFIDQDSNFKVENVVILAEFVDIPNEAEKWKGFRGRILKRKTDEDNEESYIIFKKTYTRDGICIHSLKEYKRNIKEEFSRCKKISDFELAGVSREEIEKVFPDIDKDQNITIKKYEHELEEIEHIWNIDYTNTDWFDRPGGIQGNILIKLPKFLLIPAEDRISDIEGKTGALQKIMTSLFQDVRDASDNFKKAQEFLDLLAKELDPDDDEMEFGKMMKEVNSIVGNVFPDTGLHVKTELDDADKILKPHFNVEMSSNIRTKPERQGTGSVRSVAFALLRFREQFIENKLKEKEVNYLIRNLIIGFEEPEIYLHPNAANNMRDEIYSLATASTSQMVCTTHSPFMIDLSKDVDKEKTPKQILNLARLEQYDKDEFVSCKVVAFNTTKAYKQLIGDEKDYVKFILKMDDHIARIFFTKYVIIVEGDTEEIVFRETIKRLPLEVKKAVQSNYQIIKARGKPAIIAIVKYLKAMGFEPFVMHDKDEKDGATKFNEPIRKAVGNNESCLVLENCMEDVLGYKAPSTNKPYYAYKHITDNWPLEKGINGLNEEWKKLVENVIFKSEFHPKK